MCIKVLEGDIEEIVYVAQNNGDTPKDITIKIIGKIKRYVKRGWI